MWTRCPDDRCGLPATCSGGAVMESTDGPLEMTRSTCIAGHWFFLPVAMLPAAG